MEPQLVSIVIDWHIILSKDVGFMSNKNSVGQRADLKVYYRIGMQNEKGFSIVELIVAIVVGVLFIITTNLIIDNYIHLGDRGRNLTLANAYAEAKMESLRSAGYNTLNNGAASLTSELPAQLDTPKSGTLTVSEPQTGMKQVELSITFNDNGVDRTYTYKSYIGELGVGQ